MLEGVIELCVYLGGLTLVIIPRVNGDRGNTAAFLLLSRLMLVLQAVALVVCITNQCASIYYTALDTLELFRNRKFRRAVRDVQNCESYKLIVVKRFANRWTNLTLQKPITGWPRLGPRTEQEKVRGCSGGG